MEKVGQGSKKCENAKEGGLFPHRKAGGLCRATALTLQRRRLIRGWVACDAVRLRETTRLSTETRLV